MYVIIFIVFFLVLLILAYIISLSFGYTILKQHRLIIVKYDNYRRARISYTQINLVFHTIYLIFQTQYKILFNSTHTQSQAVGSVFSVVFSQELPHIKTLKYCYTQVYSTDKLRTHMNCEKHLPFTLINNG